MDTMSRGGKRRYLDSVEPEEYFPQTGEVNLAHLSLTGLADLFGSDKGSIKHNYCEQYASIVHEIIKERLQGTIVVGEVGVACGASLRMWANYLPKSKIIGFDVRPQCLELCKDLQNVEIYIGDATNESTFSGFSKFDLFIDDGSHIAEDIVKTFSIMWKKISPGGYYVIEDLACTYSDVYTKGYSSLFKNKVENRRENFLIFFDSLLRAIDSKRSDIKSVSYYPQLMCIQKVE
jgi:hypothetical protein